MWQDRTGPKPRKFSNRTELERTEKIYKKKKWSKKDRSGPDRAEFYCGVQINPKIRPKIYEYYNSNTLKFLHSIKITQQQRVEENRGRSRPNKKWKDVLKRDMRKCGVYVKMRCEWNVINRNDNNDEKEYGDLMPE